MIHNRKRRRPANDGDKLSKHQSNDDGCGCAILVIALLWFFGYLSFHSRDQGKANERLSDVTAQLANAERQLAEITRITDQIKTEQGVMDAHRIVLRDQVTQLERARDEIAQSLDAASNIVDPATKNVWRSFMTTLSTGVLGELISAGLIALIAGFFGKRWGAATERKRTASIE